MQWTDPANGTTYDIADANASADITARRKAAASSARLRTLGVKAAKYVRDPGSNPALTTREINELLARLVLAESADDQ